MSMTSSGLPRDMAIQSLKDRIKDCFMWYYPVKINQDMAVQKCRMPKNALVLCVTKNKEGRFNIKVAVKDPFDDYTDRYFIMAASSTSFSKNRYPHTDEPVYVDSLFIENDNKYGEHMSLYEAHRGHPIVHKSLNW